MIAVSGSTQGGVMRILVGTDGSVGSQAALRWAIGLAEAEHGELVVAFVWKPSFAEVAPENVEPLRAAAAERLDEACVPVRNSKVPFHELLLGGDPREQLLGAASGEKVDLIVVGARGTSGHRHALHLGSTTHHLVHQTQVPLVAVPPSARATWPAPIVVGVDGSEGSGRAVEWLAANGSELTTDVIAVHAERPLAEWVPRDDPRSWYQMTLEEMQQWIAPLRECGLGAHTLVCEGDAVDALTDAAITHEAGMLVVGARGRGGVSAMRLGGTALKLLHHAQIPVLMVPTAG
jgi:nucleotide-binding universal stress UspA family protein